jgi:hypothetical protein
MWRRGDSPTLIANRFGMTRNQVVAKARRMGLGPRRLESYGKPARPKKWGTEGVAFHKPTGKLTVGHNRPVVDDGSPFRMPAPLPWPAHARFDGKRTLSLPSNPVFMPTLAVYQRSTIGNAAAMCAEARTTRVGE